MRPGLEDIRFNFDLLMDWKIGTLKPPAFKAYLYLLRASASDRVWTYDRPDDGGLPTKDDQLARLAGVSKGSWKSMKESVMALFVERDGKNYPFPDYIAVSIGSTRPTVPASVRAAVMRRDDWTCVYCGARSGPFDLDHIIPLARGGHPYSEDNLACACVACNRSKGSLTPAEWTERRMAA